MSAGQKWDVRIENEKIVFLPGSVWVRATAYDALLARVAELEHEVAAHCFVKNERDRLAARVAELEAQLECVSTERDAVRAAAVSKVAELEADAARWQFAVKHGWPKLTRDNFWYMDRASDGVEMVARSMTECIDAARGAALAADKETTK